MTKTITRPRHTRRYGRFTMPADLARDYSTDLLRIMGKCIIFRAEHMFDRDQIEYWANCDHFRPVSEGELIPEYVWTFESDGSFHCTEVPR